MFFIHNKATIIRCKTQDVAPLKAEEQSRLQEQQKVLQQITAFTKKDFYFSLIAQPTTKSIMAYFNNRLFLIVLLLLLFFQETSAQSKTEVIDQIFRKYHEYENFQGAVLVAEAGQVIYRQAFGLANREWNVANQPDAKFNIASLSKQFTAMLIMQLVEEGKIHIDSTLSAYYPEYRQDIGRQVTVRQLLTHRSGIPNYTSLPYVWSDSLQNHYTKAQMVQKFCSNDLEFRPGSRYQYNNTGYFLLSMIIEKVTGKDYDTVLAEKILRPLGLQNTAADHRDTVLYKRAYGYEEQGEGFTNAAVMYMQNLQGAGNLYATVDDLFAWDRVLYSDKLVSKKTIQAMQTAYSEPSATWIPPYANSYGFGMGVADVGLKNKKTTPIVFHSGHIKGFSCFFARFVEEQHTVIMLSNTGNVSTARMNDIAQQVKNVLYGLPYQIPERSLAPELLRVIESRGIDAAMQHFDYLKKSFPYEFKHVQEDLEQVGATLVDKNETAEAIAILTLNARLNPNWMAYQKLAAAYRRHNDPEQAVLFYKKAMDLNPRRSQTEKQAHGEAKRAMKEIR